LGKSYLLDLGINQVEVDKEGNNDFWYSSRIIDQGDLSTYYGYETFNAEGYNIVSGKVYPEIMNSSAEALEKAAELLNSGYTYIRVKNIPSEALNSPLPLHQISPEYELPEFRLGVNKNPTFLLRKDGELRYAVINGFLIDLGRDNNSLMFHWGAKNAMIYR
jgi:hypothetical protein